MFSSKTAGVARCPPLHSLRAWKPYQRAPQQLRRLPGQGAMGSRQPSRPCPSPSSGWRWGRRGVRATPAPSGASSRQPTRRRSETASADHGPGRPTCGPGNGSSAGSGRKQSLQRPAQSRVFIRENTPEWRCWQRHLVQRQGHARGQSRRMVVSQPVAAADGRRGSAKRTGDPDKHQEASMTKEVPEHIQRRVRGAAGVGSS
jgi:hypothetical protein